MNPHSVTSAVKRSNFLIEHQCPQCGAPATLEETDHLYACEFCKVKSYLLSGIYRYVLPHNAPGGKSLIYFPYWRFKGMLFSCMEKEIDHRIVDISLQAIESMHFPVSVGLRSQTQKLRFMTAGMEGRFLEKKVSFKDAVHLVEKRFSASLKQPVFNQSFLGDSLSLLYSPFYAEDKIYDAILNKPLSMGDPDNLDLSSFPGGKPDWKIRFIPAQCPDCGWDLDGEKDSLALYCKNCSSMWQSGKAKFMKLNFGHIPDDGKDIIYLPFWRIRADVSGIDLNSYADLVKVANLPKVVQEQWKEQAFRFWSPAFKIRPRNFLTLSRNLTLSQPQEKVIPKLPDARLHPVTLPIIEAVDGLKINLASYIKPKNTMLPRLPDIKINPRSFVLIYIPFHERGTDVTHPVYKLRVNKNLLKYAKNL